jgi:Ni,Fe-hydrogenase III small subunit
VKAASCPSCNIEIRDMKDPKIAAQANKYGIQRVPAVVIDGKLADCCAKGGVDIDVLKGMGLGSP